MLIRKLRKLYLNILIWVSSMETAILILKFLIITLRFMSNFQKFPMKILKKF
nr:MAG TPA: hypothetical protein [Bacteriophage sp.]